MIFFFFLKRLKGYATIWAILIENLPSSQTIEFYFSQTHLAILILNLTAAIFAPTYLTSFNQILASPPIASRLKVIFLYSVFAWVHVATPVLGTHKLMINLPVHISVQNRALQQVRLD